MTEDEIRALLARRADAIVRHDAAVAAADYSDDCVLVSQLFGKMTVETPSNLPTESFFRHFRT